MTTKNRPNATTSPATAIVPKSPTKSALVLKLLARAKGATIAEMAEPTGWQPHSTRAYLSGVRKQGRTVIREQRKTGETAYRIVEAASLKAAAAETPAADQLEPSTDSIEASSSVDDRPTPDISVTTPANA